MDLSDVRTNLIMFEMFDWKMSHYAQVHITGVNKSLDVFTFFFLTAKTESLRIQFIGVNPLVGSHTLQDLYCSFRVPSYCVKLLIRSAARGGFGGGIFKFGSLSVTLTPDAGALSSLTANEVFPVFGCS
jgi:hypothetical protein